MPQDKDSEVRSVRRYPRINLRCNECRNIFDVNVLRFRDKAPVECQICGQRFPEDLGAEFAKALYDMFTVKHRMQEQDIAFDLSFVYQSTFKQPPAPHPFSEEPSIEE
jgi:hypothetical protein